MQTVVELLDAGDNRQHFVNRIVPKLVRGGVNRAPLGDHFQFHSPLVAAVHVHLGRLADDNEVRPEALALDQGLASQPVAILLHIAEVIHGETLQQTEFVGQGDAVEHAGSGLFLIPGPAGIEDSILHLALERVPAPRGPVANVHRVNVRVVQEDSSAPCPIRPRTLPIRSKRTSSKAEALHLLDNSLPDVADPAHHTGMAQMSRMKRTIESCCSAT